MYVPSYSESRIERIIVFERFSEQDNCPPSLVKLIGIYIKIITLLALSRDWIILYLPSPPSD